MVAPRPWKYRNGRVVAGGMEDAKFDLQSPVRPGTAFAAGMLRVRVVGGPTALLELGGLRLLTVPTFSPAGVHESAPGRPLTKTEDPAFGLEAIGSIDAVLLSHDQHADNLDPAGREFLAESPVTVSQPKPPPGAWVAPPAPLSVGTPSPLLGLTAALWKSLPCQPGTVRKAANR